MTKIVAILFISLPMLCGAQAKFIYEGSIEFERKINVHRLMQEGENAESEWVKQLMKSMPAMHSSTFGLQFKGDRTIYKQTGESVAVPASWITGPAKENTVLTDFGKDIRTSYKAVFESNFLISDSLRTIEWRIGEEKRTIAGFDCRKAVGKICDSVYVVAFYTDEIPVSGGPESFNGLPGMILGLAIPRLHTTWFATKVQLITPTEKDFALPSRGSKTNNEKLQSVLRSSLKDWGNYGTRHIWWVML
jgi:GLPGLI family protein